MESACVTVAAAEVAEGVKGERRENEGEFCGILTCSAVIERT